MSEYIVDMFGIVQDFADLHGDMSTPLYQAIMDVMLSRQHEEIVRCRDCVYYNDGIENGRRYAEPHCLAIGELAYGALFGITEDDYCSWGERKEGSE